MRTKIFPKLLLLLGLILAVAAPSLAEDAPDDMDVFTQKEISAELKELNEWIDANPYSRPPEFSKTGIGLAAGSGVSTSAAFNSRIFNEGSEARPVLHLETYNTPEGLRTVLLSHAYDINRRKAEWLYDVRNPDNKRGTLSDYDVQQAINRHVNDAQEALKPFINAAIKPYEVAYGRLLATYYQHPEKRPLYLFEGSAAYNMVGKSRNGGAFTGLSGNLRGGIGFTFKDHGKNGCDIYFLGTANASASGFYKLDDANSARVAVGIEQGILCQIANTVTIMASPSVQAGKFAHSNPQDDSTATTDWLNYSGRLRAIVDGRLYLAAETVLHPSMKKAAAPGSHWEASETSLSVDYALSNSPWIVGADLKHVRFHDDNAAVTGMKNFTDNSLLFRAIRAF